MKNNFDNINCSLLYACKFNDIKLLKDLIENGVSLGDYICDIALILASTSGNLEIVNELINAGINLYPSNNYKNNINALSGAIENNHSDIVNVLQYSGMN